MYSRRAIFWAMTPSCRAATRARHGVPGRRCGIDLCHDTLPCVAGCGDRGHDDPVIAEGIAIDKEPGEARHTLREQGATPSLSDLRVAGSREGVDAVGGQAEGDEGEQPLPEGLLLQGAHRAVEAAGLATVLVPGREDEESAHDQ